MLSPAHSKTAAKLKGLGYGTIAINHQLRHRAASIEFYIHAPDAIVPVKVCELIHLLSALDPDAELAIHQSCDWGHLETTIAVDTVWARKFGSLRINPNSPIVEWRAIARDDHASKLAVLHAASLPSWAIVQKN